MLPAIAPPGIIVASHYRHLHIFMAAMALIQSL